MTTTQRLAEFETAQEILVCLGAHYSNLIFKEQQKPQPDEEKIKQWLAERDHLIDVDDALRFEDMEGIEKTIATYGPQSRKVYD